MSLHPQTLWIYVQFSLSYFLWWSGGRFARDIKHVSLHPRVLGRICVIPSSLFGAALENSVQRFLFCEGLALGFFVTKLPKLLFFSLFYSLLDLRWAFFSPLFLFPLSIFLSLLFISFYFVSRLFMSFSRFADKLKRRKENKTSFVSLL